MKPELPAVVAQYHEAVRAFYEPLVAAHRPDDAARVGWSSGQTQRRRFERLVALTDISRTDSVLDLGCGTGALVAFLRSTQAPACYLGIDLMADNVLQAQNEFATVDWASFRSEHPWNAIPKTDIVVASGVFALPSPRWHEVVQTTLRRMLEIAGRMVVVNFLRESPGHPSNAHTRRSSPGEIAAMLQNLDTAASLHLEPDCPSGDIVARIDLQ